MSESAPPLRWIVAFFLIFPIHLNLQSQVILEDGRSLTRSYGVNTDVLIDIESKYGNIHIETWDQPKAEIAILVRVKGTTTSDLKAVLERVSINLEGNSQKVSILAGVENVERWTTSDLMSPRGVNIQFKDGHKYVLSEFELIYTLKIPVTSHLRISHKFGDVYVDKLAGTAEFNLKYGNLQTGRLSGNSTINLNYSKGIIANLTRAVGNLHYGNISVREATWLKLHAAYSVVDIQKADSLILGNKYNQYAIESVDYLVAEEENSDLIISRLSNWGDIHARYGKVDIQQLTRDFSRLNIEGTYTQVNVETEPRSEYLFQLSSDNTDLSFPAGLVLMEDARAGSERKVIGKVNGGGRAQMQVNVQAGELLIK